MCQSTAALAAVIGKLEPEVMTSTSAAIVRGRTNHNGYAATRPAISGLAKLLLLGFYQISSVSALPLRTFLGLRRQADDGGARADADDPSLWLYLGIAAVLVLLGGAFAGLTIA